MSGKVETKNDTQRSHLSSFTMKLKDKFHPPKIKRVTDKVKRTPDKIKRTPSKRASKPPANLEIKNIDAPTNKTVCVLEEQEKEVVSALRYFKTIVDKMLLDARVLEMLPASASKVLEAVVPLVQLEPRIQHSKTVSSCLTRLHQSLANLIRWSDQVMLQAVALDDKETVATVTTVIRGVLDDVKELVRLTVERQDGPSPTSPVAPTPDTHLPDGDCSSSPEPVPSALPGPTHPGPTLTQSETARLAINQSEPEEQQEEEGSAPPKPALPNRQTPENSAPVLPPKRRQITAKVAIVAPMRRDISLPEKGQFEDQCVKRRLSGGSVCGGESSDLSPSSSLSNLSLSSTRPASLCMEAQDQRHSTAASLDNTHTHTVCADLYDSDYDFLHEDLSSSETLPPFPLLPPFPSVPLPPLSSLPPLSPLPESPSPTPLSVSPVPPALPQKRRQSAAIQATPLGRLTLQRRSSHYDNVAPDEQPPSTPPFPVVLSDSTSDSPPPLPEKKKHIFQYLQFMEDYSEPQAWTFYQRPANHSRYQQRTRELQEVYGLTHTQQPALPAPALPPKQRQRASLSGSSHSHAASFISPIPSSSPSTSISPSASLCPSPPPSLLTSPFLHPEEDAVFCPSVSNSSPCDTTDSGPVEDDMEREDPTQDGSQGAAECVEAGVEEREEELCLIDQQEVMGRITLKSEEEEGPDVRAASADILLVHATVNNTPDQELYCDAFLATYRSFISPQEIIRKLHYRYSRLCEDGEPQHLRASKNTFLLLVRVVDELCSVELVEEFQGQLMELVFSLLIGGDLCLARLLRSNILSKLEQRRQLMTCPLSLRPLAARGVAARPGTLLDFRSQDVADQLTLMDAELFYKIELPEVLLWSKEQNEEKSPNLTQFTQHFNSMSYWVRSLIILQEKGQDREKLLLKFLKVMKHLRKLNNFNSYLAILSALDSAPLRRLDWQRQTSEGLEEYSTLIDSSSSFRTYRAALAEVEPPCIPYLGLILQDLTFVHLGNPDLLVTSDPEGSQVNFSKRWQQFNILDTMRSFQQVPYELKPSEEIVSFFNDFSDHLSEEALWELSLKIRPRNTTRSNQRHGNS